MRIQDLKPGDKCVLFLDEKGNITGKETSLTITGTVVAVDPADQRGSPVAFGWKGNESRPTTSYTRLVSPTSYSIMGAHYIDTINDYSNMIWVSLAGYRDNEFKLGGVVAIGHNTHKSAGEFCAGCKTFSPYAAPNNSKGTFTCFSCRTYPHYKSYADDFNS